MPTRGFQCQGLDRAPPDNHRREGDCHQRRQSDPRRQKLKLAHRNDVAANGDWIWWGWWISCYPELLARQIIEAWAAGSGCRHLDVSGVAIDGSQVKRLIAAVLPRIPVPAVFALYNGTIE